MSVTAIDERRELRVLVLVPTAKDAELTQAMLQRAGVDGLPCRNLTMVGQELQAGVGAILLAEESLDENRTELLATWLRDQPAWSDLPLLILARTEANSRVVAQAIESLGNVTILERPIRVAALISAVRVALRARRRQYQIRDHLSERERNFEAQARLAAIVTSSDDVIISKTLDGEILTWNAAAERLFGYTAEEAIGQSILMLIPEERLDEEPALIERLRRGERIEHFETVRIDKAGRQIDISLTISPLRNAEGIIVGASKVARDIRESKRSAETVRSMREELQVVTDNMAVVVTRCSRDFQYLWASHGCSVWLGRPSEQIVGHSIAEVIGEEAFAELRPRMEAALQGQRVDFESLVSFRNIGPRWVRGVYVPTHSQTGEVNGWVEVITDLTEHHRMADALRDDDRRKDEFLAVLAHELRNPLAPIRNSLQILRLTNQENETSEKVCLMMERQVDHMVRLVDDLMEVSRITRGKIELRRERIDLATVIRTATEASRPLIDAAGHQLAVSIPVEPLILEADAVRLSQVFSNLLNNAAKYTNNGGQIWLTIRPDHGYVSIRVRDNGLGISQDMLPRVFDLFAQARDTAGKAQGGLGIGLTLVKSIVELHGGTVSAQSEGRGKGSEFCVSLPLVDTGRKATPADAAPKSRAVLAARRVLVVDDNRDAAQSLAMLLRLLGADVQVAFSGKEALEVLHNVVPAAVILDIGMPEMDGYQVARRIREKPELQDVVLIALTGWGQEQDRRLSQNAGFNHHLVKPVNSKSLEELLKSVPAGSDDRRT